MVFWCYAKRHGVGGILFQLFSKKQSKHYIALVMGVVVLAAPFMVQATTPTCSSVTDCQTQQAQLRAQLLAQQKQAQQAQQQVQQLGQKVQSLQNSINTTSQQISDTQSQINQVTQAINDKQKQIAQTEAQLATEKQNQGDAISTLYQVGGASPLQQVLGSNSISEVMQQNQYLISIETSVQAIIDQVNKTKATLDQENQDLQNQQAELNQLMSQQQSQKVGLTVQQQQTVAQKANAAATQQNATAQAAQLSAAISSLQKKIDQISAASVGKGGDIVSGAPASWYLQQTDSRWSGYKMGNYATIGMYGCLLTSLTMIADFYGASYTPATAADVSSFVHTWGSSDGALIGTPIVSDTGTQPINWNTVDSELANNHPVIVGVALGIDMGNAYGVSHFVVLTSKIGNGKYAMQDPLGTGRGYLASKIKSMKIIRSK